MDGFMQALQEASASQDAYVAALPMWVQYWMYWMMAFVQGGATVLSNGLGLSNAFSQTLLTVMAVLFAAHLIFAFWRTEARWLLLAMVAALISTMALGMSVGWNKLWGVTHLVFWTPVVVYYIRRWPLVEKRSAFGVWFVLALATMIVSLVFDAKDVVEYLLGV